MKKSTIVLVTGLLLAAPASQLSARTAITCVLADEPLSDGTVQAILDAVAPQFGASSASLYDSYQSGDLIITYLGPVNDGYNYRVRQSKGGGIIIVDIVMGVAPY